MSNLDLLFIVLMLVYSIYGLIFYFFRRAENKVAFRELRSAQPIRTLTAEERRCVRSIQADPAHPERKADLLGDSVYRIEGEFLRHGIEWRRGHAMHEIVHDTIADVEVVLPYDAVAFLQDHNVGEVILTSKFAIVLKLNDDFDIREGRERADRDARAEEQVVDSPGEGLSIEAEAKGFRAVYRNRYVLMGSVGAMMVIVAWVGNHQIDLDFAHLKAGLSFQEPPVINQPDEVYVLPPEPGSIVRMQGKVRCQIPEQGAGSLLPVDCSEVRWGAPAPRVAEIDPDPVILSMYNGDLVQSSRDRELEMVALIRAFGTQESSGTLPEVHRLRQLTRMIVTIDQECSRNTPGAAGICARLQDLLVSNIVVLVDRAVTSDWESLLELARSGRLAKASDHAAANRATTEKLRKKLRQLAELRFRDEYAPSLREAIDSQQGGVVLRLNPSEVRKLRYSAPYRHVAAVLPRSVSVDGASLWQVQWEAYRALSREEGLWPLEITGLVQSYYKDDRDGLVVVIVPERTAENVHYAALRLAPLFIGLILLLMSGILAMVNIRRASLCKRALETHDAAQAG